MRERELLGMGGIVAPLLSMGQGVGCDPLGEDQARPGLALVPRRFPGGRLGAGRTVPSHDLLRKGVEKSAVVARAWQEYLTTAGRLNIPDETLLALKLAKRTFTAPPFPTPPLLQDGA